MEPFDFPDSDPGPHTLRAGQEEEANIQRLTWALSRFTGYAGVTNLLGQRFLSDSEALAPMLTYLARRGLYFFDNGAASQSVVPDAWRARSACPSAQSGPALDSDPDARWRSTAACRSWKTQARANGSAVGSAFLYPVTVARIAAWAKGLEARGFVLVPVSAIVSAAKTITAWPNIASGPCFRSALPALRRHHAVQRRTARCLSASASTRPWKAGRCRRAASTRAKRPQQAALRELQGRDRHRQGRDHRRDGRLGDL